MFFGAILTDLKKKGKIGTFGWGFCFPLIWLGPIVFSIFVMQNHFSATFLICLVMIMGGKGNTGVEEASFRSKRIQTWLNPFSNPTGEGWQIINSLYAIGSGGMFGAGLGEGRQKYSYLPEPHNDFIFAILAEELGFLGCIVVIALFVLFIWRGIIIALRAPDTYGSLVTIGIVCLIGLQAMMNIAVVTGTIPVTGVPLPFFSYGGTAMIANLIAVIITILAVSNFIKNAVTYLYVCALAFLKKIFLAKI